MCKAMREWAAEIGGTVSFYLPVNCERYEKLLDFPCKNWQSFTMHVAFFTNVCYSIFGAEKICVII